MATLTGRAQSITLSYTETVWEPLQGFTYADAAWCKAHGLGMSKEVPATVFLGNCVIDSIDPVTGSAQLRMIPEADFLPIRG